MHVWLCQRMTDGDHGRDICAGESSGAAKVLNEEARNILPGNASLKEVVHLRKAEIQPSIRNSYGRSRRTGKARGRTREEASDAAGIYCTGACPCHLGRHGFGCVNIVKNAMDFFMS